MSVVLICHVCATVFWKHFEQPPGLLKFGKTLLVINVSHQSDWLDHK